MLIHGYVYFVEGEYVGHLEGHDDPADEDWKFFEMRDLHPAGQDFFTVWSQFKDGSGLGECDRRARGVVEWMRGEKHWDGFIATLWRRARPRDVRVATWELA